MEAAAWHALPVEEVVQRLGTSDSGLGESEARRRLERHGPNELPERKPVGVVRLFLRQFRDPLIYILLIAAVVSFATGNLNNGIFISAVLLLNAAIGTLQEAKAESSAQALESIMRVRATVLRDGRRREIESEEVVPGDLIELEGGRAVPADLRLVSAEELHADESLLTGESTPVDKRADEVLPEDAPVGDRVNLLHAGSTVVGGRARGVVCRTGTDSEVGQIAESLARGEAQDPPLVVKMRRFTRLLAVLILVAIAVLSVVQVAQGASWSYVFLLAVALAVSAIPAGLPVAMTVALSIAANRMAKRNVIVRQLPAVEGLGSCTLVASDKTGTLTANELTVKRVQLPEGDEIDVAGEGLSPEGELSLGEEPIDDRSREQVLRLAESGALANAGEYRIEGDEPEAKGDTNDVAFLVLAAKVDRSEESLRDAHPEVGFVPFESDRRFAASFNRDGDGVVAHVKGAVERVLPMCGDVDADAMTKREGELASQGYRVLAVARGSVPEKDGYGPDDLEGLELLGLVGLIDPTREEVPEAVARCRSAGVEVRMITGDHPATGLAIARQIGIAESEDQVLTGAELRELEEAGSEDLERRIRDARVLARVEPQQKTRIVESLQGAGHFVAVTGDGVNDAPALRSAHIGVAMGRGGTDVARGAADLILTDDNFASIVSGIEEGRVAFENVRKVIWLLLATGAAEVLLFFLAIFAGMPIPLTAVQLLWLNLVTNGIQDVALAFEKGEPGVLERPPRSPRERIIDPRMIQEIAVSGMYIGLVAFGLYYYLHEVAGVGETAARNLVLLLMVLFENIHALSCRSERRSLFRVPLRNNPLLLLAIVAAHGIHLAAMHLPGLSDVLQVEPVSLTTWLTLLPIAASLLVVDELAKLLHRRTAANRAA